MMSPPASRTRSRSRHGGSQNALSQNTTVNSIPSIRRLSARQRSRLQTAAYLLGTRQELPDVDEQEINRIRAVQSWYSRVGSEPSEGQLTVTDHENVSTQADHSPLKGKSDGRSQVTYLRCSRPMY
jgi:hypothetical protein